MTRPTSLRFPDGVRERLQRAADLGQESASSLAVRFVDEGLRMAEHPGIGFHDSFVHGRVATLVAGPDVAEVMIVLHGLESSGDERLRETASWLGLTPAQVRTAMRYYVAHADEVDAEIATRRRIAAEQQATYEAEQALLR